MELLRNQLIPLVDGATLAAGVRLPEAAGRYPAIACFYPYHKDDLEGSSHDAINRYFTGRGYATVDVDFYGLGSSSGTAREAMHPDEASDGAQMIEWIAAQPWCDGNVGQWGISYPGITSFKVAAARPPPLKANV